jgi:glycogen debranching enzyme
MAFILAIEGSSMSSNAASVPPGGFHVRKLRKLSGLTQTLALIWLLLYALPAASQNAPVLPQLSRSELHGEFVSAVGRRAALLGTNEGRFEAWVYPLKIVRDLHLQFHMDGQILAAEPLARTVITRPESTTIVYGDGAFQVRETLFVPIREAGAIITFEIQTQRPVEIEIAFKSDFQLEWPAALGPSRLSWDSDEHAFLSIAQDHPYAAVVGSPSAYEPKFENPVASTGSAPASQESSFLLGVTKRGKETKVLCIAASLQGRDDAAKIYDGLIHGANALELEAANYYREYLRNTVNIDVPDGEIRQAYDWARINLLQGIVDNPLVGTGLVAGYGPSGETQRPGYDWFFGRDALWTSLALDSEGDFADARRALELLVKYQRADGKIPHEVPQSETLVPWFQDYPYGYAAADATPLFVIAMRDYVERSGDVSFAGQEWDSILRAYKFLNSTLDSHGFAQNLGVGHGWVESGPLLPVRTEIYQAALGIEALRSISALARLLGKDEDVATLQQTFERERERLNERFWLPDKHFFAFALDPNDRPLDEDTVLPAVPMWFGLFDAVKAGEAIAHLAAPDLQADWGMRIVSSSSPRYASDGYHFGSVWPLFTGWASVGEYRYHRALEAYLNLRANALLALDGSPGHVTEVLNGDHHEPLSTSTPQQIWSAAMIVSPLLRGLFGLETDAADCEFKLTPHVPAGWNSFSITNLQAGATTVALQFRKDAHNIWLQITRTGNGQCALDFSPALSLRANVTVATLNGRAIPYRIEGNDVDQHVSLHFDVPAGRSTLRVRINDDFALGITSRLPALGSASQGLRIISTSWTPERDRLNIEAAGIGGQSYELSISSATGLIEVEGAELNRADRHGAKLVVRFPSGPDPSDAYVQRRISLRFAPTRRTASQARN